MGRSGKDLNELGQLLELSDAEKSRRGFLYTPREIAQQPETWPLTFDLFRSRRSEIKRLLDCAGLLRPERSALTVFLIGAGTSDYIGHALAYLLRKSWQCEVVVVPSTDLLTHMDELVLLRRKYLWISFSRSGDSPEGVAVLERALARYPEIHHLVVSCNANGRMVREHASEPQVLAISLDDRVNDRGLAMTSSFTNMVIFGQCLAHVGNLSPYEDLLSRLVQAATSFLPRAADRAAALAAHQFRKAYFVGSGPLRAVARESALKLVELTAGRTLTMSESVLGLRHGPMAALDRESLFVCFLSGARRVEAYERDLLHEIGTKHLAEERVVVGGSERSPDSFAEHYLSPASVSSIPDDYRAPVDVIFGQLLGLFSSIRSNLMPDAPSPTGTISRVVENVSIYS